MNSFEAEALREWQASQDLEEIAWTMFRALSPEKRDEVRELLLEDRDDEAFKLMGCEIDRSPRGHA